MANCEPAATVIPLEAKELPDASMRYTVVEYEPPLFVKYGNPIAVNRKLLNVLFVVILQPTYPVKSFLGLDE